MTSKLKVGDHFIVPATVRGIRVADVEAVPYLQRSVRTSREPLSVVPSPRLKKTIESVPGDLLTEWSYKLFGLMNLAWDYVDTVCDLCIGMKLVHAKKLVRQIRELKREYDKFRHGIISSKMENNEVDHGLAIEDILKDDFYKMYNAIEMEVNKQRLTKDNKTLVIAVHQAMALIDAAKSYARWCDKRIAEFDVWVCDYCMIQKEFLMLDSIIPKTIGMLYIPNMPSRKLASSIIANKIKGIGLEQLLNRDEIIVVPD